MQVLRKDLGWLDSCLFLWDSPGCLEEGPTMLRVKGSQSSHVNS